MAYDVGMRLGIDGEKTFRSSIDAINANIKSMGAELKAVAAQFDKNDASEEALAAKNQVLAKSIAATKDKIGLLDSQLERQAEKLRDLGRALDEVVAAHGKDSDEAARAQNAYNNQAKAVAKLQSQLNGAKADLAGMESAVRENQEAIDGLGREVEDTGEAMEEAGRSAVSFGDLLKANLISDLVVEGLRKITDGIKDFARFSLDSGMNFEAQMSRVQAISGATAEDAGRLAEKAKEMGETTVFSATESAQALEYMAMAGWKTDDMLNGLAGVMNLAAASGEDLASTSDIVTDALTAFGLTAADSSHFADVLAVASSNANTNVGMMGETFKYVAPVAGALGYSAEDSAIAIGLMANSGIKASQAGTALRSILSRLAKPTKESEAAMNVLGISLKDSEGNMKSLLTIMNDLRSGFGNLMIPEEEFKEILQDLNRAFEEGEISEKNYNSTLEMLINRAYGAEEAEKARWAAKLAGQEAMSGMLAIVSASEEDYQELTNAIYNADDAAETMAKTMTDNLSGSLTLMQSAAEGVGISLYEKVKEPLTNVINDITNNALPAIQQFIDSVDTEDITNGINGFLGAMELLTPVIVGATTAMVAYKTASNIVGLIDKLKIATNSQTVAQAALNAVLNANPFVLVATAIAGLVTGLVTLYMTNETFRTKVNAAWTSVTSTISGSISRIQRFFAFDIPNAGRKALDWFKSIPDQMKQVGEDLILYLWNGINDKVQWLKNKVGGVIDSIKGVFGGDSAPAKAGGTASRRAVTVSLPPEDNPIQPFNMPDPRTPFPTGFPRSIADTGAGTAMLATVQRVRRDIDNTVSGATSSYTERQSRANGQPLPGGGGMDRNEMVSAFREAMDGMGVFLDGRKTGRLVAVEQSNMGRAFGTA
ncbi:phage tail tape measure protein [Oscillospiraceae bacterium 38-13]